MSMNSNVLREFRNVGIALAIGGVITLGAVRIPKIFSSNNAGSSAFNAIDLSADSFSEKSIRYIYQNSDADNSAKIPAENLNRLINSFNGEYVKVQTGETTLGNTDTQDKTYVVFSVRGVCIGNEPALRLYENGQLVGNTARDGSSLTARQIYNAPVIPTSKPVGSLTDNACAPK
jgi:hypothetical protein